MKMNSINKMFTEKVANLISAGYVINPESMSGHQGEIGKVDLIQGDKFVRLWLNRETDHRWGDSDTWNGYKVILRVSIWKYSASDAEHRTVWMSELETVEEDVFYEISRDWYIDNLEEALECQSKRSNRWRSHRKYVPDVELPESSKDIAGKYLKRKVGYKRIHWDSVKVRKNQELDTNKVQYHVFYKDQVYRLK